MGKIKKWLKGITPIRCIWHNLKYFFTVDMMEREYELMDLTINNCVYELEEDKKILQNFNILDEIDSYNKVMNQPKSFCRMGDGEIDIMKGVDTHFQKYDPRLAEKLKKILAEEHEDMYVAINRAYFHSPLIYGERNKKFYRMYGKELRTRFIEVCNPNTEYLDAGFLCAYYRFTDDYDYFEHFERMLDMFKGKKIVVVSGEGVLERYQYDVFQRAAEKRIIHGPAINAFSEYENILDKIYKEVSKEYLICLILGMTAKVMVPELTNAGYMAWDVGHIAKDYNVYMEKKEKTDENMSDFWGFD